MRIIPLDATPNQVVTARLGGVRFEIRLRDIGGMMAADITRADEPVLRGVRAVAGTPLIPYRYLEAGAGNLIFLSSEDNPFLIPYWPNFGTRTRLIYASEEELRAAA